MIFSRKKKPKLIFRNNFEVTPEIAPRYLSQDKPSWFSNMPKWVEGMLPPTPRHFTENDKHVASGTIRRCPAFSLFFQRAILIPSWTDVAVTYYADGNFTAQVPHYWGQEGGGIDNHSHAQHPGAFEEYDNLKITDYWKLEGTKGLDIMIVPVMPPNPDWEAAMGAWEPYAERQHIFNINLWLKKPPLGHEREFMIKRGEPLCYVVPLSDTLPEIEVKVEEDMAYWRRIAFGREFDKTAEYLKHKTKIKR